jgi:hypothetical protein
MTFEARRISTPPSQQRARRGPRFCAAQLWQIATLCRPNSRNEKTRLKLSQIGPLKNRKNGFQPFGHRSVELHFDFCFQQNAYAGVGCWLQAAGRGPQKDCKNCQDCQTSSEIERARPAYH